MKFYKIERGRAPLARCWSAPARNACFQTNRNLASRHLSWKILVGLLLLLNFTNLTRKENTRNQKIKKRILLQSPNQTEISAQKFSLSSSLNIPSRSVVDKKKVNPKLNDLNKPS